MRQPPFFYQPSILGVRNEVGILRLHKVLKNGLKRALFLHILLNNLTIYALCCKIKTERNENRTGRESERKEK